MTNTSFKKLSTKFPNVILDFTKDYKIRAINKNHVSGDLVYDIGNKYILKVSLNKELLLREKESNDLLINYLPVSRTIIYLEDDRFAYLIKTKVDGVPLTSIKYLNNPSLLIRLLIDAYNMFHSVFVKTNYKSTGSISFESFVHGDFCLPNILVKNNKVSGFIDLGNAGMGDPLYDLYWCIWSFEHNLKTSIYTKELLDYFNIEIDEVLYKLYIDI